MLDLDKDGQLAATPPVVVGGALVVPGGALDRLRGATPPPPTFALDHDEVERRAVAAVIEAEWALDHQPTEMARNNPGFDIRSELANRDLRFIEVKGRIARIHASGTFSAWRISLRVTTNVVAPNLVVRRPVRADLDEGR